MTQSAPLRLAPAGPHLGSSFLWIKLADRGFAPVEVTFARAGIALVLAGVALTRHRARKSPAAGR